MHKKIIAVVTLILCIGLGVFLWSSNQEEKKQIENSEKLEEARRPLLVEKQNIEEKIAKLDRAYEDSKTPKGTTQILFTGFEEDVYNTCYPIMKEFEYTGTLALSLNQLPGMEGLMSLEQFQELLNEGWDVCIKWDAQTPVNNWWPKLQKQVKELGIETVPIIYFTTGTYTSTLDAQLQDMGFSIVVHHGEESDSLIQLGEEEGLWHLGAVGLMGEKPRIRLEEAIAQKGNITYLVGFELQDERYDERSFRSMLSYFDAYEASSELRVANMDEARQHYRDRLTANEGTDEAEYKKARERLEAELAAVEEELSKIETQ